MTNRLQYTFTILRYVHDVGTGEFVNVGVVLHCASTSQVISHIRESSRRAAQAFPGLNAKQFKNVVGFVRRSLANRSSLFFGATRTSDALTYATSILPKDDSSFQWSPIRSGITSDLEKTAAHLFERLITKYEVQSKKNRRDDAEVWVPFCKALERRQLVKHLTQVEIVSAADSITFKHAWKNGQWHCLEPLSFDLLDGESIRNKARRVVGQMTALKGADAFKLYVLVGEPQHSEVQKYYEDAMKILEAIPVEKAIFTEKQADAFSQIMLNEISSHPDANSLL
jgi:hypothetical protein